MLEMAIYALLTIWLMFIMALFLIYTKMNSQIDEIVSIKEIIDRSSLKIDKISKMLEGIKREH